MKLYRPTLALIAFMVMLPLTASAIRNQDFGFQTRHPNRRKLSSDATSAQSHAIMDVNDLPASAQGTGTIVVQIGGVVLNVPKSYVDSFDGFQSKSGYLRIRAELPCLTPVTVQDPRLLGKGWGSIVNAKLDVLSSSERTGKELLKAFMDDNDFIDKSRISNKDRVADEKLIAGTAFHLYEDNLLSLDFFTYDKGYDLFVLECRRHSELPSPQCSSRSVIDGTLLLDYEYGRPLIDQSIMSSLSIDEKMRNLISNFRSTQSEINSSTQGVCK